MANRETYRLKVGIRERERERERESKNRTNRPEKARFIEINLVSPVC
jgi:hypothetical protein